MPLIWSRPKEGSPSKERGEHGNNSARDIASSVDDTTPYSFDPEDICIYVVKRY
jgi:hypothetical protein